MDFRFAFSTKIAEDWNNMTGIKMIYEINNKNEEFTFLSLAFGIAAGWVLIRTKRIDSR